MLLKPAMIFKMVRDLLAERSRALQISLICYALPGRVQASGP